MTTPQAAALIHALGNIRLIHKRLAATEGKLTKAVFSTNGSIPDMNLDTTHAAVGLEFESLVQNIRALKKTDPILQTYPDIQLNLKDQIARRNWVAHEYGTTAPIKWNEIADSIFDDVPKMESAIIAALKAQGIANP